eukprot:CAMPEP_0177507934 /NCGR_PEP_ID=MMETSP0369-20130122/40753_1 /TAXON_ID=447022 ORGANISM="Scrippsiella hangoei-like, Strain SHHI-4" /NCGR_SAMPLE_ID=MMETSP0369 /ASSEMBLY_ACC=CAM_ASM_000364 /LENGTH=109 /DNA_ID=CAMNT_0018986001 /DNA_START=106 /DNA_END=435 /DNA_ORIENTATION=-
MRQTTEIWQARDSCQESSARRPAACTLSTSVVRRRGPDLHSAHSATAVQDRRVMDRVPGSNAFGSSSVLSDDQGPAMVVVYFGIKQRMRSSQLNLEGTSSGTSGCSNAL